MEELRPPSILVVEDEQVTRLVISNLLRREGFNVVNAEDGSDALRVLKGEKVDLILSDIHMPGMDGFTFFEKVQRDANLQQIPFIFLTSMGEQEHLMIGKELGVDDYLTKPVDRDVLLASIRGKLKRAAKVQVSQTEELEDLKRQVIKLLSVEVKAPLDVVTKLSSLLLSEKLEISSHELTNVLQSIRAGGERFHRSLDDFIMSLHIDSGLTAEEYEAQRDKQDLPAVIAEILSRSASYAKLKQVDVVWQISTVPSVVTARKHLEHILERLVYSAVAFSSSSSRVEISVEVGTQQVMLKIKDGGAGFGEDEVAHIFNKFPVIGQSDADQYPLGLGLYTAKRLAEINKCDLTCFSHPGKGTTFMLTIPTL